MDIPSEKLVSLASEMIRISAEFAQLVALARRPIEDEDETWVGVKDASLLSGISTSSLNYYARCGKCRCRRVGKHWRFPQSQLSNLKFLQANKPAYDA